MGYHDKERNPGSSFPAAGSGRALRGRPLFVGRSLLFAAVWLAGCMHTEYQRPPAPVASDWPTAGPTQGVRSAAQTDWRAFFPDARLQALIAAALEHNRDLRIAVGRVEEARAQYGITRAERLPNVNMTFSRNAALTPADLGGTNTAISGQRYDVSVNVISYEVDFWGRISGLSESARASFLASEEARRAARLSLISDVANGYFSLLEIEERATLSRSAIALREKALALVQRGRELGFASNVDYFQAESALQSARTEAAVLERERAATANNLQFLVGHAPSDLPTGRSLTTQSVIADLAVGLPSEVLLSRPDVLAAEQRLIAAHASIGAARAAFLPRILLTASFGVASRALSTLFMPGNNSWAFQPALSAPLFDGGRNAGNLDLAKAREVIAVADYEKTIQQAFREVADLLATRAALAQQQRATEANAVAMEGRAKTMLALYKGGQSSYLEVLDAQRDQLAAQQAAIQVRRAQLTAAAQLYKALGGGE